MDGNIEKGPGRRETISEPVVLPTKERPFSRQGEKPRKSRRSRLRDRSHRSRWTDPGETVAILKRFLTEEGINRQKSQEGIDGSGVWETAFYDSTQPMDGEGSKEEKRPRELVDSIRCGLTTATENRIPPRNLGNKPLKSRTTKHFSISRRGLIGTFNEEPVDLATP